MKNRLINLYTLLLLSALLLSSCATSLRYWEEATTEFNKGAKLEMMDDGGINSASSSREEPPPPEASPQLSEIFNGETTTPTGSAEEMFQRAYDKIEQALAAPEPLRQENKLGNAYTIKALAAWKTNRPDVAEAAADQALQIFQSQPEPSPRDEPLARAVPGLVSIDIAYDSTRQLIEQLRTGADEADDMSAEAARALMDQAKDKYQRYVSDAGQRHSIANALIDLDAAIAKATENKQLRMYLRLAQLSALKNQYDLWSQMNNFAKRSGLRASDATLKAWLDEEEENYLTSKDKALAELKSLLPEGDESRVYKYWDARL